MVRVAVVQIDPTLGDKEQNLALVDAWMARAAEAGAELAVFPECALTGYVYESTEEAIEVAEPIQGPTSFRFCDMAARHGLFAVAGMLELDGEMLYNSAILAGPDGFVSVYRKTHTLCLGVDRFTAPGDIPYRVIDLPMARVGVLICYDLRFPETARLLALAGVQLLLLPTNWPVDSAIQADVFTRSRAAENRIFVLAADRVGRERGATFLGRSQIVTPTGAVLQEAPTDREAMLIADIDPADADVKNIVVRPREHEMDVLGDRRPDLYQALALTEVVV